MMKNFLIDGWALVVVLSLLACSDHSSKADDDHESGVKNPSVNCVPRSTKALKKESLSPSFVNSLTGAGTFSFDVVVRDFEPNHPDFENFSEEAVNNLDDIYNYISPTGTAMKDNGYDDTWYGNSAYHNTCGNASSFEKFGVGVQIGIDGLPIKANPLLPGYLQGISAGPVLEYGECAQNVFDPVSGEAVFQRGFKNAKDDVGGYKCSGGNTVWNKEIVYTPGMVDPYLMFTKMDGDKIDMHEGVVIQKISERCDNQFFNEWFTDVPGKNKRINMSMDIPKDPNSKYYIYDYSYNNGGFFPLDSINPITKEWVMRKPCIVSNQLNGECDLFEPQTLSIFCPPYKYQYAATQMDFLRQSTAALCMEWLNQGGPRVVNAGGSGHSAALQAAVAVGGHVGFQHLRNSNFTMMGYANFKYKAANQVPTPEVFEIIGDDDIWVFIDGVLVVDLGGTHLPTPGKVDIQTLAKNNHGCHMGEPLAFYSNCKGSSEDKGWADDTWHHLHFFYAKRQSDASDLYIRTSLAEFAHSQNGLLTMNDVVVKKDENGVAHNGLLLNVPLADSSLVALNNPNVPSMVVLRSNTVLGADGKSLKNTSGQDSVETRVLGFFVSSITGPIDKGSLGQLYQFEGVLKDLNGNIAGDGGLLDEDLIAFNVPWSQDLEDDGNGGNYSSLEWTQLMAWSKKFDASLGGFFVASGVSGVHVAGFFEREMWGKVSYASAVDEPIYCDE